MMEAMYLGMGETRGFVNLLLQTGYMMKEKKRVPEIIPGTRSILMCRLSVICASRTSGTLRLH